MNKFKHFIATMLFNKTYICLNTSIFIGFSLFFIFVPFLVKDGSAAIAQTGFDFENSIVLSREHSTKNVSVFSGVGKFFSFEYLDNGQESYFNSFKSFILFIFSGDDTAKQSSYKDGQQDKDQFFDYWLHIVITMCSTWLIFYLIFSI